MWLTRRSVAVESVYERFAGIHSHKRHQRSLHTATDYAAFGPGMIVSAGVHARVCHGTTACYVTESARAGTATPTGGGAAGQAYIAATNAAVTAYLGTQDSGELAGLARGDWHARHRMLHTIRNRGQATRNRWLRTVIPLRHVCTPRAHKRPPQLVEELPPAHDKHNAAQIRRLTCRLARPLRSRLPPRALWLRVPCSPTTSAISVCQEFSLCRCCRLLDSTKAGTPAYDAGLATQQAASNASLAAQAIGAGNTTAAAPFVEDSKNAAAQAGVYASQNAPKQG